MTKKVPNIASPDFGKALSKLQDDRGHDNPDKSLLYAAASNTFFNDPQRSIQVRPPFSRKNYEYFRPNERIPEGRNQDELREIMVACTCAYERVGIIRSVIDMMSEFAAEGVEIIHEDQTIHQFYQNWSERVHLEDRVERFLSWAFKAGNVIVRRKYGNLDTSEIRQMKRTAGLAIGVEPGRIPLEYVFYNPSTVELVGGHIGAISNKKVYALRIPMNSFMTLTPKNELEKQVFDQLPTEIKDAIKGKSKGGMLYIPIPEDRIFVGCYKKDDTDIWAKSFIYSILSDVYYNDKVKMAKTSTMDGMINVIRLWKLGDHTNELLPSPASGAKLANILGNHQGGGAMDIIWDSAIALEEFYPPIETLANFEEKYDAILLGLGVPELLVGGSGGKGNPATATIGLKNMIKRLEAGRRLVRAWLNSEIDIIQKNMRFQKRPQIRFSNADLHDERTYFTLLRELADRNVIPEDRLLEIMGEFPEFEKLRMQRQEEEREAGKRPKKASPFHNPQLEEQQDFELQKIKEQAKLKPVTGPGGGNNSNNLSKKRPTKTKKGRPPGSRDKVTRTRKPNRTKAELLLEATRIHDTVENYVTKMLLAHFNVKDVRSLTSEQKNEIDSAKSFLLPHVPPFANLNDELMVESYNKKEGPDQEFNYIYNQNLKGLAVDKITNEQKRLLRIDAYVDAWLYDEEEENEDNGV